LVGNLATVRIPIGSGAAGESNLIPFSSVSFEPDGAEVLVLDNQNIAQRQKIVVGRVVVSSIEVVSGLNLGDKVVEYYKRVLPGEKVINASLGMTETDASELTADDIKNENQTLELKLEASNE
jgi:hypothetical protein